MNKAEIKTLGIWFMKASKTLIETTDKRTDVWSRNFLIWEINFGLWAVALAGPWEKGVWANSEQLFWVFFSLFRGQKNFLKIFWKHYSVRTKKLHNNFKKKIWNFFGGVRKSEKTSFF